MVISNGVFFVLVFGRGFCFVLQVNGDGVWWGWAGGSYVQRWMIIGFVLEFLKNFGFGGLGRQIKWEVLVKRKGRRK
jgi:hypothetical protein